MNKQQREQHLERLSRLAETQLKDASSLQQNIDSSKTSTKRAYYEKKMKQVRKDVQEVLATIELLRIMGDKDDTTSPPSA